MQETQEIHFLAASVFHFFDSPYKHAGNKILFLLKSLHLVLLYIIKLPHGTFYAKILLFFAVLSKFNITATW